MCPHGFTAVARDGVAQMTYLNHEGVPEVAQTPDYFATTTLFRRHHFAVPLTEPARDGLRFWRGRSKRGQYLLYYDNGKSVCRAGLGARPLSQHLWKLGSEHRSCTALADPRRLDVENYRVCEDPCILHFPVCGLDWFLGKYKTLGDFPDSWLGGQVKLPASFHGDARDACAEGTDVIRNIFEREVLLDDPAQAERQVQSGVCLRLDDHASLLEAVRKPVEKPAAVATQSAAAGTSGGYGAAQSSSGNVAADSGPQGIELGWILSKSMNYL
eukprot:TRINITY_DN14200_c0_g1_i1.p2 TRINITY_DN14200_c0_g1~~TRINITY_DN14200_c0_g1_i1.p2  ORF type:complete len:271 (+),score=43.81 TRINITY_DN14200_c0_g1_i1:180-992(+)